MYTNNLVNSLICFFIAGMEEMEVYPEFVKKKTVTRSTTPLLYRGTSWRATKALVARPPIKISVTTFRKSEIHLLFPPNANVLISKLNCKEGTYSLPDKQKVFFIE